MLHADINMAKNINKGDLYDSNRDGGTLNDFEEKMNFYISHVCVLCMHLSSRI